MRMRNEIVDGFNPDVWIKAIHDNWVTLILLFGRYSQWEMKESKEFTTITSGVNISMFNVVSRTRLESSNVEEKIKETIEYFSSKGLSFRWQVYPGHTPDDLSLHLENHGLIRKEGRGMALEIDKLKIPNIPDGFTCKKATTPHLIEIFANLLPVAYGAPEFAHEELSQAIISIGLRDDFQHYVGFLDDEPVATSSILYSDGVAGIHNVSSLPSVRGKGIGSYISAAPLFDALSRSYKISTLMSSDMGKNVYKRLGYVEYCKPVTYEWNPS